MTIPVIPAVYGLAIFIALFGLLVQKEVRRAWRRPELPRSPFDAARARRWRRVENALIGLLLGVYGLILLARLLRFFA